ncbi:DUF6088 family protein [Treponema sp.]|uniref:DUF6088 family protein n=1 Tax=Treponema sp. TaxID=166 RepID=UPI00298E01F0|nr:DUF6088 family protein [Treponema sp.]MCQ2240236.1 DUF6088 family protein [Treponema sp.]
MRESLYSYITSNFKPGEAFFYEDIKVSSSIDSLRHQVSRLVREGKLAKHGNGTFFIPKKSILGLAPVISTESVAVSKYIKHGNNIIGYYSGYTFANQIGISLQVPMVKEIITNESSAIVRTVKLNKRNFQIRRPKVAVDNSNYKILQLLSLLENYTKYIDHEVEDADEKVKNYAKSNNITRDDLYRYAGSFNSRALKTINYLGL